MVPAPFADRPCRRTRAPRLVSALAIGLIAALVVAAPASARHAPAHLRMTHFSPDTPAVDVYVTGFDGQQRLVLAAVTFGQVSAYLDLPAGTYTLTARPAGADPSSSPMLVQTVQLDAGQYYTLANIGAEANLTTRLLTDDLAPPPAGDGTVRLIQAVETPTTFDVRADQGPDLALGAHFGDVTAYATVPAQSWTVTAKATDGSAEVSRDLQVQPGSVATIVLLPPAAGSAPGAGPDLRLVADAAGMDVSAAATPADPAAVTAPVAALPAGGVNTGGGWLAVRGDTPSTPNRAGLGLGLLVSLTATVGVGVALAVRRRRLRPLDRQR